MTLTYKINRMFSKIQLTAIILMILSSSSLMSQNSEAVTPEENSRELGLRFSGLDDFNIFYKKHLQNGRVARHRFLQSNIDYNSNNKDWDLGLGYAYGQERYKEIADDFFFFHGMEGRIFVAYSNSTNTSSQKNKSLRLVPALGYVMGFQLALSDRFSLSLEIIPSIGGNVNYRNGEVSTYQLQAQLNSNTTGISLMYRFVPKS